MLPKINRLGKTKEIERVFKEGQGIKTSFLFIKTVRNNLKTNRFAFIVSKKIAVKANQRNQIKRRLRGIIEEVMSQIKEGFDVVIVAQKGITQEPFQDIKKDILAVLGRIKLLI